MDYLRAALAACPPPHPDRPTAGRHRPDLELAIRPCPKATWIGGGFLVACALQAVYLQQQGALLPAAAVAVGTAAMGRGLFGLLRSAGIGRLCLRSNGPALLHTPDAAQEAWVAPCSLRLGRFVLLVLRRTGRPPLPLLLGPGNLSAQECAALGRWLRQAPGGNGTAAGLLG